MTETFRFLMECRPERLIVNLLKGIEKKSIYTRQGRSRVYITAMEYVGEKEVVALETDTHTYIAEGLASHNCNIWRALQHNPDEVAKWCDWPVNHADLSARKRRLLSNEARLLENLIADDEWFDAKLAGYWIWAASCWIGSGLTRLNATPHLSHGGMGVHALGKRPHLSHGGMGVHTLAQHGESADEILEVRAPYNPNIYAWFRRLSERLRSVRVVCGDWSRVCGGDWQDGIGDVGIFFDPPYSDANRDQQIYHKESQTISYNVRAWAIERGKIASYRIVIAGYEGEHEELAEQGWTKETWSAQGGYANLSGKDGNTQGQANRHREVLWYSPRCLQSQMPLFAAEK